ncbi:MAG: MBL fold metallo-hydrolase [Planctomycetota bacterium]|nr:MAG: MBL fold metallo-hydrolase [Planctomycetota bacterium]
MIRTFILSAAIGLFGPALGAQDLEVYFLDVGQGDSTLIISPTGTSFLFDAGDNGKGNSVVVPFLTSKGISHLDFVGASHYHADHVGGLDEVWDSGIQCNVAYDRGTNNTPGTQSYSSYASRYSGVRQTVSPGQVVNLGGGATMTCLSVEGQLIGGGSVNISGSSQWENSASVSWLLEYGDFQMFVGGDLTGGGNSTTDVESALASQIGDIDVLQVNHHGSRTSTNSTFTAVLKPEFALVPCGSGNVYGYPKQEVVNRLSYAGRTIAVWSLTDGVGTEAFVDAGGTVELITDGNLYTITAADGTSFTCHVDEQAPSAPGIGDVVTGEFLADPSNSSETDGEWIELTGARVGEAVTLNLIQVNDYTGQNFTIRTGVQLLAGETCLIAADGLPSRNGGVRPIMVWPTGSFSMNNSGDTLATRYISTELDRIDYSSSWPGGNGVSDERMDLLASGSQSNFAAGTSVFGAGDRGTPGDVNDADTTQWGGGNGSWVEVLTPPVRGGLLEMNWHAPGEFNSLYQGWCSLGTSPGFTINGTHIPANQDAAYQLTYALPGWSGFVPINEVMYVNGLVPSGSNLQGLTIYGIFVTYKDVIGQGIDIRTIADPIPMVIQ